MYKGRTILSWFTGLVFVTFAFVTGAFSADASWAADFDPKRDFRVRFSSEGTKTGPGFVVGEVTNVSRQDFSCIILNFGLSTRFDQRRRGEASRPLGVLPVEVRNLRAQTTKSFRRQLPFPSGLGLASIETCDTGTAQGVAPPRIVSFKVSPHVVRRGAFVKFFWQVRNAERVRLFDDFGEVKTRNMLPSGEIGWPLSASGEESISIKKTTIFRLVAENRDGRKTSRTFTVRVGSSQPIRPSGAPAPVVLAPFKDIQVCGKVADVPDRPLVCRGPDRVFGREVNLLIRFFRLSGGRHTLTKTYFWGDRYNGRFRQMKTETRRFFNPKVGAVDIAVSGQHDHHGVWKLELRVDGSNVSSIQYCVQARCR